MQRLQKWDYETQTYKPYDVPDDWVVRTFSYDMNETINCAECGKKILYGDGYTSRRIHTEHGFGYCVCEACEKKEYQEELKAMQKRSHKLS